MKIVTKKPDKDDDDGDTDIEDITSQYKNPEGILNFHPVTGRTDRFFCKSNKLMQKHLFFLH